MFSNRQSILVLAALTVAMAHAADANIGATIPASKGKFLSDDPLWKEPSPRSVPQVKSIQIDDLYDFINESFVVPHHVKKVNRSGKEAAQNTNTLGEVPDSEWYTNRHMRGRMSVDALVRGAGNANPPDPEDKWKIISAKTDGVTPGFTIEDAHGNRYLLKFDPPNYPELASAADVIGSKIFYALGYNTPENYIAYFHREQLTLTDHSSWRDRVGKKHVMTQELVDKWLAEQPKDSQGRYRAMASRWIAGKVAGPFEFEGTRSDDPNDIVPHELHRELRGMAVFSAWLNDTDAKSINTLDSLVDEGGVTFLKHYRIDWGASLGSDSVRPKDIRRGHDYLVDARSTTIQAFSFGFYLPEWMRTRYPNIRGVGTFDFESFDAAHWRSNYPITPYLLMDNDDAFWAAKQVMAFSDEEIRAIVETAQYSDPRATDWVTECLIKRRDKIGKEWLSPGLALDGFRLEKNRLVFVDLAEKYKVSGARYYNVQWAEFDNATRQKRPIESAGTSFAVPAGDRSGFLVAAIRSGDTAGVEVYLRRTANGWDIVGVDRHYE